MKRIYYAAVLASVFVAGGVHAAELVTSAEDARAFNSCKAMEAPERNASAACRAVMQKTKVTSSDMDKMKACESPQVDVAKDPNCKAMLAKHPEVARGHGRLEPDMQEAPKPGNNGQPLPSAAPTPN